MKLKKSIIILIVLLFTIFIFNLSISAQSDEIKLRYGSGSPPTSSGYPGHMKVNELVDSLEGVSSTFVGIGASEAAARGIYDGDLDWGGFWGLNVYYESTNGLGKWKGEKRPNILRSLCATYKMQNLIVIRENSGINSIYDLDGKEFSMGIPGSTGENLCSLVFEALGIHIKPFIGSLADAVSAFQDGRIVGFLKDSPVPSLDSSILDAMTSVPISILSFTEEEKAIVNEKYPYIAFNDIPAGYYIQLPELGEANAIGGPLGIGIHKDIPDDVVYKMIEVLVNNWELLGKAWGGFTTADPLDTPQAISVMENVFLHPGALRYFKDKGVTIPDSVIPPEMK